jgi:hypothetical protein
VHLTAAHWVYLIGVVAILATMIMRKNIVVPAVAATFLTALVFSGSLVTGLAAVFNASLVAAVNLFNIFLIIALVTAMLGALKALGADRRMVTPFRGVMRNGHVAFWVLAAVTYVISLFFWPTPAVPLIGAVLIPVAIRAGLSPMGVGLVVAIAGQGMALSSDYIIRVAPGLSAKAAGANADVVADRAMVLSLIVGMVALGIAYFTQMRQVREPAAALLTYFPTYPALFQTDLVASANTLGFTVSNVGQVLGPLGAGLVLLHGSFAWAYGVDAALFTVAMWAALRLPAMPPAERGTGAPRSRVGDLVESMRYLRTQPVLLLTFAIDIAAMVLAMPRAVFPEVAAERFGGERAVGWLYSAIAIGAVIAGLGSGWVGRIRRQGVAIVVAVVGWGLAVAAAGLAPALWLAVFFLAIAGAADLVSAVYRQTILLTFAPDEMRGRMQGVFMAVVAGGPRLGDLRVGAMAAVTGATVAWVSGGIAAAVVAVLLAVAYPALLRYVVPGPGPASSGLTSEGSEATGGRREDGA